MTALERELFAELDALLQEAGPELAQDLGADLLELQAQHKDERKTMRPGEAADWSR